MFKYEYKTLKDLFSVKYTRLLTFISLVNITFAFILPYINSYFIDGLVEGMPVKESMKLSVCLAVIGLGGIFLSFIENILKVYSSNIVANIQRDDLIDNILNSQVNLIEKYHSGYLSHRVYTDINRIVSFVIQNYLNIFFNMIKFLIIIIIIYRTNKFLIIPLFILTIINIVTYKKVRKPLHKHAKEKQERENMYFQEMQEQLNYIEEVQMYNLIEISKYMLSERFKFYFSELIIFNKLSYVFGSISGLINVIFQSFMFIYGAYKISIGSMTIGEWKGNPFLDKFISNKDLPFKYHLCCHS